MQQPRLIIVAGCNGSGKSTYSQSLVERDIIPFDYDKRFSFHYNSLSDSELREQFAMQSTTSELETLIRESFAKRKSVCFETNFVSTPMQWFKEAKSLEYIIEIYFFCLSSLEKAKERVLIRAKNNGHFVEDEIVEYKWKEGYKNLNNSFQMADKLFVLDNSIDSHIPVFLFELKKIGEHEFEIVIADAIPEYVERRMPNIFELLKA
jgi:predicted ABC-type ATPase